MRSVPKTCARLLFVFIVVASIAGCGSRGNTSIADQGGTLTLAPQFGLAYLPDVVMTEQKLLEKHLPGVKVEMVQLSGGGAVVEQLLSGSVDIGYMGVGPFLKARDSGADVKVISCLEEMPLKLMTFNSAARTIADLKPEDRIALPGPNSHQAITLAVAAKMELGDPTTLNHLMVSLPHPDAMAALVARQEITAHFTQPPFVQQEENAGAHSILNSFDVFGQHCLIVAVVRSDFQERNPKAYNAFREALGEAIEMINKDPRAAATALSSRGDATPVEQLVKYIEDPEVTWTQDIRGLQKVGDLMKDAGLLKSTVDIKDATFGDVNVS